MRAAPVGERAVRIAPVGLELAPVVGQPRVAGGEFEASGDDPGRRVILMRGEMGGRQQPQFADFPRRGGNPVAMRGDRGFRLAERRLGANPLVPNLVGARVERDRPLVLLDGLPDRDPAVAFQQVAVLAQQQRVLRPVQARRTPLRQA